MDVKEMLPSEEKWPDLTSVSGLTYPEFLNASLELLDQNVRQGRANNIALRKGKESLTYGDLLDRVERFATALAEAGIGPGDRVLLRLLNSWEFVVAWLSILRLGAIVVATIPLLRSRELKNILEDCGPNLAICQDTLLEELQKALGGDASAVSLVVAGSPPQGHTGFQDWLNVTPSVKPAPTRSDDIALISYTSGSTGDPKGTVHFHRDVLAIADTYSRHVLRPTEEDVFSGHPTLAFTFGLGGLLIFPFRVGASAVFIDRFTPETMLTTIRDYGVTITFCVPTSYKMMLDEYGDHLKDYLPKLRLGVSAGETLPASVFSEWKERTGITLLDGIGATEMLHVFVSSTPEDARAGSTGKPVPGYQVKIVDESQNEVPLGAEGFLAVKGPTGCRYWNRPDQQKEYVRDGWNFPGDIFTKDEDGYFHYCCRSDDMIICGGINISGPEVESVLIEHPAVKEVAVVASPDELKRFVPKAFVVLTEGYIAGDELILELQDFVKNEVAPYKYPRKVEFVDRLPRVESGKIRRVVLRKRELKRSQASI